MPDRVFVPRAWPSTISPIAAAFAHFQLDEPAGTILPVGTRHVLSLYRQPKLIDLSTGAVVHVWTELNSGRQVGSILWHLRDEAKPPPTAFDHAGNRFAIVNRDQVTVIAFNHSASAPDSRP